MTLEEQILLALTKGPMRAADLLATAGVSQPTLSRSLARLSGKVAALGRGRATRYALRRAIRELTEIPVSRVDSQGRIETIGALLPIRADGLWYDDREHGKGELFSGMPWFLADMRPQGFLGRLFAHRCGDRGLPERLSDWNDDHVLYALATLGEDQPGNLVLGAESHERWQGLRREGPRMIPAARRDTHYRERVARVLAGEAPGSSAGGEQQKFGAAVEGGDGEVRHCIVKFSPPYRDATARRWADLLVWEHLAKEAIRAAGLPAATTSLFDDGERMYLEVVRFDRVGLHGRRGIVSFGALDDAFVGQRRNWSATAQELARLGWISREDAARAACLEGFGRLIGNTDMHFGNLSVLHEGEKPLALSPAYDMLPMTYAPRATGEMQEAPLAPPALPLQSQPQAASIAAAAVRFWHAAAEDARVSEPGRRIAITNAAIVSGLIRSE